MEPAPDVLELLRQLGYEVDTDEQALAACEAAYGMLADQAARCSTGRLASGS